MTQSRDFSGFASIAFLSLPNEFRVNSQPMVRPIDQKLNFISLIVIILIEIRIKMKFENKLFKYEVFSSVN